jgi:(4-O-methyl)-D-glucuronate---lignin esterase
MTKLYRKLTLLLLTCLTLQVNAQSKEWEKDIIYSEEQVLDYELPNPLLTLSGKRIKTPEEWLSIGRPQLMGVFASTIYGRVPKPESPIKQEFELLSEDSSFFGGRCTRKLVLATFSNDRGSVSMHIALFTPNQIQEPVPVLLRLGFGDVAGRNIEMKNNQSFGQLGNGTPLIDFINKGFGVALIKGGEVIKDEVGFRSSIHRLFYKDSQSMPRADEWGVLAGISWQLSRAMDYLETQKSVDKDKVAIVGFSKLGKSTLWAGASDTRFAMVLSQNSGCAGAALWKRKFGENLKYMARFPHWLCDNAKKYIGVEEDLPVDQHMLLACIAPRPVYVVSGINDMWADNMGEYLSTHHATPVYELFGLKGQPSIDRPEVNVPVDDRALAYHVRSGAHGYEQTDWDAYIKFMDYHFNKNQGHEKK